MRAHTRMPALCTMHWTLGCLAPRVNPPLCVLWSRVETPNSGASAGESTHPLRTHLTTVPPLTLILYETWNFGLTSYVNLKHSGKEMGVTFSRGQEILSRSIKTAKTPPSVFFFCHGSAQECRLFVSKRLKMDEIKQRLQVKPRITRTRSQWKDIQSIYLSLVSNATVIHLMRYSSGSPEVISAKCT